MKNKPFIPASPPLLLLFFLTLHFTVAAQSNLSKNNVAVSGFDVFSYHKNKAIEGNVNHKVNHKGAVYLFDNEYIKVPLKQILKNSSHNTAVGVPMPWVTTVKK